MNTNHFLFASLLLLASAVDVHAQSFDIDLTKTQPTYSVENGSDAWYNFSFNLKKKSCSLSKAGLLKFLSYFGKSG
nr:hypothetical protein [uncultured Prevotella sp.]